MKKILMSMASLLLVLPLGILPISANETETSEKDIIEEKIDETVNQALNDANITELSALTNQQEIDLVTKVNEIKSYHSSYYMKDVKVTPRASFAYYGDVLATLDEKTIGIPHGHAGYDIDYNRVWGTPILPSHLMLDGDTYLKEPF